MFTKLIRTKKDWLIISLTYTLFTALLYGVFIFTFGDKMGIVYKNWDGPSYVVAAISLYDPKTACENNFIQSPAILCHETFLPAHFPAYPWMIRAFSFLGYFPAMLGIAVVFGLFAIIAFYELVKSLGITKSPLWLTLPMILLPPRWFIVSHVGGSEAMFLFFLILLLKNLHQKRHFRAALYGSLAQLTRSQGVLIFAGISLYFFIEFIRSKSSKRLSIVKSFLPYIMMPLTLLLIFSYYKLQTNNFYAFFRAIEQFKHFHFPPFRVFTYPNQNIETFWQEVNVYNYVLALSAAFAMFKKKLPAFGLIALVYFFPLIFIQHSDISRYAIPLMPFVFIAYSEIIESKPFRYGLLLMSPAFIAYAINFMRFNHSL